MKKKTLTLVLIICAVLAVVLVSVIALTSANNDTPAPEVDDVSVQNQPENNPGQDPLEVLDSNTHHGSESGHPADQHDGVQLR